MKVAYAPGELDPRPRTVAIGVFDGVHLGHRAVIRRALEGPVPTVLTFDPHPRAFFGHRVPILSSLERRLELLAEIGVEETLVVPFDGVVAGLAPDEFAETYLAAIGATTVIAGADFRFGYRRSGDLESLRALGFNVDTVPLVPGISSSQIRELVAAGAVRDAAPLLGRAFEVEGVVVPRAKAQQRHRREDRRGGEGHVRDAAPRKSLVAGGPVQRDASVREALAG
jgi:riboflavin kinase/FMN adenylyltransferase